MTTLTLLLLANIALLPPRTACPCPPPLSPVLKIAYSPPPSHNTWDALLRRHVNDKGQVNYKSFKKDIAQLQTYLNDLKKNPPQNSWSKAEVMAFWINAYNAFTIKLILDNYPLTSITKLDNGKTWDVKRISIGNKTYSLNEIENDLLRKQFNDPRIHFAINCAAKSCPPLLNQAWTAANLENNLENQTRSFINNPSFNSLAKNKINISKIFEWYAADFGNLIAFLNRYSKIQIQQKAGISYLDYSWALNE